MITQPYLWEQGEACLFNLVGDDQGHAPHVPELLPVAPN